MAALPDGDCCSPSVSEIVFSVCFLKTDITHLPGLVIQYTSARSFTNFSIISLCATSCVIFCFSATVLTFQLSLFPLLSLSILSCWENQSEQVGPRSYRTQVQQAERLASWCFSTCAKCVVVLSRFNLFYLFYFEHY